MGEDPSWNKRALAHSCHHQQRVPSPRERWKAVGTGADQSGRTVRTTRMERLCSAGGSISRVCWRFNLIHLPGRLAKKNGELWCGKLGEEITTAEGKQAARSVAIELLATLQAAIGDLNDVRRIVKLLVVVNSGPHFTEAHMVANGASEVFIEVFEERGAHARSALGVSQIPFGCCVEIEMVVEAFVSGSACEL